MDICRYTYINKNPFNIVAEIIVHLRNLDANLFENSSARRATVFPENIDQEVDILLKEMPTLNNSKELLRKGIPSQELKALYEWQHFKDFSYMMEFLSRFTERLPCEKILESSYFYSLTHSPDDNSAEFLSLNDNVDETKLLVLPLVQTINDSLTPSEGDTGLPDEESATKKHWATDRLPGIHENLSNVYYVEVDKLHTDKEHYQIKNSILKRLIFTEGKKKLKIAVCPIAHKDLLNIKTYTRTVNGSTRRLCEAECLKDQDFVCNRIKADILKAAEMNADIVLFPEMLGTEHILSKDFFDEVRCDLTAQGYPMPGLILPPTLWHNQKNSLYAIDGSGKILCIQQKQIPYLYKADDGYEYEEDISSIERIVHVLHIPGVGRLGFPICKDYLKDDYIRMLLQQLRVTFLMCPSYSPGKTQFDLAAPAANQYGCYTVWGNTCAAYFKQDKPPEQIGLVAGPQTDKKEVMKYLTPVCDGACGGQNDSCVFLVEIDMDHSANISCRHLR